MQTFLPYASFPHSAAVLDRQRLGKQRVDALKLYHDLVIREWLTRGYKNNMPLLAEEPDPEYPFWFGDPAFHAAHRSNLLRKNPQWYGQFGWTEPNDLEYMWPVRRATV